MNDTAMEKHQMERARRLEQASFRRVYSVPPVSFSPVAVAAGLRCNGLTLPLPGGMGARVRFEKN